MKKAHFIAFILYAIFSLHQTNAQPVELLLKADKPKANIQSTMWGVFFEDINFAADGGLYAEMVKNRSFEFLQPLMGWQEHNANKYAVHQGAGNALIINELDDKNRDHRFARISLLLEKGYGLTNEGFRGMGVKKGMTYNFSVWARQMEGENTRLRIELSDSNGKALGQARISITEKKWKKYEVSFVAGSNESKAKLNIWFDGKAVVDIDMISLFPNDTWKHRPGGLRKDLVQLLADMRPGFIRFPGGCIVEGRELATRYQWKKTIGNVDDRELIVNRWNTEFTHRPAPDYFQSFGLGFFEYFLLSEDLGAEPLPILSCGMACQFNTAEVASLDQLDPYIQDALDLIEFANGSVDSRWGKIRWQMGHEKPFNLKFIGIGNEQWGPQYIERYKIFSAAIKSRYPDIKLISGAGPFPNGELFDYAETALKSLNADIIDEHYYNSPDWFLKNVKRYDQYDRSGPKIFAGEYAAQSVTTGSPKNKNTWNCALSEAAFMTGLERNADVVTMASYAPLFAHAEGWQWTPDLIWFDNLNSYGTPSYYVQKLFSNNKGSNVIPILYENTPVTGQQGIYASASRDINTHEIIIKLVNTTEKTQEVGISLEGLKKLNVIGNVTILKSEHSDDINSFDKPMHVSPQEQSLSIKGKKINLSVYPYSFSVLRFKE